MLNAHKSSIFFSAKMYMVICKIKFLTLLGFPKALLRYLIWAFLSYSKNLNMKLFMFSSTKLKISFQDGKQSFYHESIELSSSNLSLPVFHPIICHPMPFPHLYARNWTNWQKISGRVFLKSLITYPLKAVVQSANQNPWVDLGFIKWKMSTRLY